MIGLTFLVIALTAGALAEGPSGKQGATSYSVYHRKFEPSDGGPRSVSYSTKLGPKHSSLRGENSKDSPTSYVKGSSSSKDTQSYLDSPSYSKSGSSYSDSPSYSKSGSSYSDSPSYSKSGSSYSDSPSYSNSGSSYSNDGPTKENYSNDGPSYSKSSSSYLGSGPPNHSGERYDGPSGAFSPSSSYNNDGPTYDAAPHSNNPPPVYDTPNVPQDVSYNSGPSYVPPPPANVPQYDGQSVSGPFINGGPFYPAPQFSSYSSGQSNFPVNVPNVNNHPNVGNFPNIPNVGSFQSNIPNIGHYPNIPNVGNPNIPNIGNLDIPNVGNLNIPNIGNLNIPNVGNLNIPKPSFSSPYVNPGQFSYPIDRSGSQFSTPLKDNDPKSSNIKSQRKRPAATIPLQRLSGLPPISATTTTLAAGLSQSTDNIQAILPPPVWLTTLRSHLRPTISMKGHQLL